MEKFFIIYFSIALFINLFMLVFGFKVLSKYKAITLMYLFFISPLVIVSMMMSKKEK